MVVHLTPDVESALNDAARAQGIAPDDLANEYLRERFVANGSAVAHNVEIGAKRGSDDEPEDGEGTLADFLEGYIGVVGGEDPDAPRTNWSEDTGRKFAELLQKRRAEGHL
jgi:hypothetical protein